MLTLSLLVFSVIDVAQAALSYWIDGNGEPMTLGPWVVYELVMVVVALAMVVYYRRENRVLGGASTMLEVESRTTLVDGMLSGGIGIGAVLLLLVPMNSSLGFLHYTGDFFITVMLVLATVKEPCVVLHDAFIELIGGVVLDEETTAYVERQAREHRPGGTRFEHLHVFKTGMNIRWMCI